LIGKEKAVLYLKRGVLYSSRDFKLNSAFKHFFFTFAIPKADPSSSSKRLSKLKGHISLSQLSTNTAATWPDLVIVNQCGETTETTKRVNEFIRGNMDVLRQGLHRATLCDSGNFAFFNQNASHLLCMIFISSVLANVARHEDCTLLLQMRHSLILNEKVNCLTVRLMYDWDSIRHPSWILWMLL